ncbi:MAG: type II toxin-antitoxin system mRNA interferase toxin, RelE/StbE family [Patescibacteria group bacterium]
MIVRKICYSKTFVKEAKKLPKDIVKIAIIKERIFKDNPLHPSLRLHELHGKLKGIWSISLSGGYRIIFERMKNGDILFISVGKHDLYKSL